MKIAISPLRKQNTKQFLSNSIKPIPQGFMTLEDFSKMLDDKITAYYEKLPDEFVKVIKIIPSKMIIQ